MKTNWQSYLSNVNGVIASIFVDLEYVYNSPYSKNPKLAWLWIKLEDPNENGLSTDSEFDSLCKYEDNFSQFIKNKLNGYYVGRITTKGRREFYFYIDDKIDFNTLILEFLQSNQKYLTQFGSKPDHLWEHYSNVLYPGEEGLKQIKNK